MKKSGAIHDRYRFTMRALKCGLAACARALPAIELQARTNPQLENQLHRNLNRSGIASRRNRPECSAAVEAIGTGDEDPIRCEEVRMIGYVERFPAQLQLDPLRNRGHLAG